MAIRAVIFDLGGVLLEIDWERYQEDQQSEIMSDDLRPYEQLNQCMRQRQKSFFEASSGLKKGFLLADLISSNLPVESPFSTLSLPQKMTLQKL
jgi:FMN phosphatase YigB (HAD superfamily)